MADSKVIKVVKSSQLLSNLSTMEGEVRDRTIFLQVSSECHSWSDVEILALFSEFGMVEEVELLPTGNHFHSQIRYETEYDRECACYYYQDGWLVHQNCCEIQVCRADEIVCGNAQRIDNIKAANVGEESTELLSEKEPNLAALKVFDEMPNSNADGELVLLGEFANINQDLVDDIAGEDTNMGSVKILGDMMALEEGKTRDTILLTHALKFEFAEQARLMSGVVNAVCFDPGGDILSQRNHSMCLSDKNSESPGMEDSKLVDEVFPESYVPANPDTRISCAEHEPQLVVERNLEEKFESLRFSMVVDFLANGSMFSSFSNGAEVTINELVVADHKVNVIAGQDVTKAFREVMMVFDMGSLSLDPGGLMAMNAHRSLVAWAGISFSHFIMTTENSIKELKSQSLKINSVSEQKEASVLSSRNGIINLPNHRSAQEDRVTNNLRLFCFDPGGTALSFTVYMIILLLRRVTDLRCIVEQSELQKVPLTALKCVKILIAKSKHHLLKFRHQHVFIMDEILGDASMYAQWVASLLIAKFWRTYIYGLVFDPGGEGCKWLYPLDTLDWCCNVMEFGDVLKFIKACFLASSGHRSDLTLQFSDYGITWKYLAAPCSFSYYFPILCRILLRSFRRIWDSCTAKDVLARFKARWGWFENIEHTGGYSNATYAEIQLLSKLDILASIYDLPLDILGTPDTHHHGAFHMVYESVVIFVFDPGGACSIASLLQSLNGLLMCSVLLLQASLMNASCSNSSTLKAH